MLYIEMRQEVLCMPITDDWIDIKKNWGASEDSLYPVGSVSILEGDGLFSQNLVRNKRQFEDKTAYTFTVHLCVSWNVQTFIKLYEESIGYYFDMFIAFQVATQWQLIEVQFDAVCTENVCRPRSFKCIKRKYKLQFSNEILSELDLCNP